MSISGNYLSVASSHPHCRYLSPATIISPAPRRACRIRLSSLLWLHSESCSDVLEIKIPPHHCPMIALKWLSMFLGVKNKNCHCGLSCPVWTGLCCPLQLLSRPHYTIFLSFLECARLLAPSHSLSSAVSSAAPM